MKSEIQSIMQSIHPKWCQLIVSGKKTIELRKTRPKIDPPFKVYIYQTKYNSGLIKGDIGTTVNYCATNSGKVIGEYICDRIDKYPCYYLVGNKEWIEYLEDDEGVEDIWKD